MKKLPLPESQAQEVLFELINRIFIDRQTMMLSSNVWNLTARISELRQKNLNIISNKLHGVNKYGREIEFVQYSLEDKKEASKVYLVMKSNQRPKVCTCLFSSFESCPVRDSIGCLGCECLKSK